jgi:adenine-specific DNA-methyltransferase
MAKTPKKSDPRTVETLTHTGDRRKNIPTAEYQSIMANDQQSPVRVAYDRRNRDLDPQLVWRGKDEQDWSALVVPAPPLFIQEKVHPKVLIDDLLRSVHPTRQRRPSQPNLFADFNGIPDGVDRTDFYQHDANWSNRMILGDSLQVMASLAEREGLRGQVQCIYLDPPYGIKFNSNFQWSTTSRDVKDGNPAHITREPEQVKAFRDTWRDGIHSYLTYLRDRLTVARDLLHESGSIFVQIGDENLHRVRDVLDEVFGADNFAALISITKGGAGLESSHSLPSRLDYLLWYAKNRQHMKFRHLREQGRDPPDARWQQQENGACRRLAGDQAAALPASAFHTLFVDESLTKPGPGSRYDVAFEGRVFTAGGRWWGLPQESMNRALKTGRIFVVGNTIRRKKFLAETPCKVLNNLWDGLGGQSNPVYVVQTNVEIVKRCLLMTTDPGDLVLDPTCGSGTTAYVAEQWGRRWITIDTSRVALALARARLMGARYPYYLLADSREGQWKEAEVAGTALPSQPTRGNVRHGFVYERVPHITLKSIANNAEIDVIWDKWQAMLEPTQQKLNAAVKQRWEEWQVPREADPKWPDAAKQLHAHWWAAWIARQKEMDASIAARAEFEYLYDKPYEDKTKVRVAGPFTVESLSPHRTLGVDENDEIIDPLASEGDFDLMILETLKTAGVQQAHKDDRITFTSLVPWPGTLVCAEGRYLEGVVEKRAAVFIGPEFGTVQQADLVAAAREAGDAGFDVLVACAFNYDVLTTDFTKLGRISVLKARMNADLHMAGELKNTGQGNLFFIFGEPDITLLPESDGRLRVRVNGVDVFDPSTGAIRSDGPEGIACWFVDTDYNEECFFVRQAYFLGQNDPYSGLKTTLKAEIDADAWATLNSDTSRPFDQPRSGRIAVKVINHLGDEVMKVFKC